MAAGDLLTANYQIEVDGVLYGTGATVWSNDEKAWSGFCSPNFSNFPMVVRRVAPNAARRSGNGIRIASSWSAIWSDGFQNTNLGL